MKRKAVIGILCAALILTLALGVLAACNVDPDTYTVTFYDAETSQVVSAVKDVEAGYVLKASDIPAAPVYSGKRFAGWFIGDSDVEVGAGYTVSRSVMATARYTDEGGAVTQYTVTFELGEYDGSGQAPAAQTVNAGSSITLPAVGVTWAGHRFTGWKANNTEYEANATYTVNGNVTFVAQWSADPGVSYTVTFELGEYVGAGQAPAAQTVSAGSNIALPDAPERNDGYGFIGWKSSADGKVYSARESYKVNANVTFTAQWGKMSGTGTKGDPYVLYTAADLKTFADNVNHPENAETANWYRSYVRLGADIDMTGVSYTPAGSRSVTIDGESGIVGFSGVFDGDGHTISNLSINVPVRGTEYIGLFGLLYDAVIHDVNIENMSIVIESYANSDNIKAYVGAVAGAVLNSSIYTVHAQVDIATKMLSQNAVTLGGIAGMCRLQSSSDKIKIYEHANLYSDINVHTEEFDMGGEVSVLDTAFVGGVYGMVSGSYAGLALINASAAGSISGKVIGGIMGYISADYSTVVNAVSTVNLHVTGQKTSDGGSPCAGGIVGEGLADMVIMDSFADSDIFGVGDATIGGIIGVYYEDDYVEYLTRGVCVINCYYSGELGGSNNVNEIGEKMVKGSFNQSFAIDKLRFAAQSWDFKTSGKAAPTDVLPAEINGGLHTLTLVNGNEKEDRSFGGDDEYDLLGYIEAPSQVEAGKVFWDWQFEGGIDYRPYVPVIKDITLTAKSYDVTDIVGTYDGNSSLVKATGVISLDANGKIIYLTSITGVEDYGTYRYDGTHFIADLNDGNQLCGTLTDGVIQYIWTEGTTEVTYTYTKTEELLDPFGEYFSADGDLISFTGSTKVTLILNDFSATLTATYTKVGNVITLSGLESYYSSATITVNGSGFVADFKGGTDDDGYSTASDFNKQFTKLGVVDYSDKAFLDTYYFLYMYDEYQVPYRLTFEANGTVISTMGMANGRFYVFGNTVKVMIDGYISAFTYDEELGILYGNVAHGTSARPQTVLSPISNGEIKGFIIGGSRSNVVFVTNSGRYYMKNGALQKNVTIEGTFADDSTVTVDGKKYLANWGVTDNGRVSYTLSAIDDVYGTYTIGGKSYTFNGVNGVSGAINGNYAVFDNIVVVYSLIDGEIFSFDYVAAKAADNIGTVAKHDGYMGIWYHTKNDVENYYAIVIDGHGHTKGFYLKDDVYADIWGRGTWGTYTIEADGNLTESFSDIQIYGSSFYYGKQIFITEKKGQGSSIENLVFAKKGYEGPTTAPMFDNSKFGKYTGEGVTFELKSDLSGTYNSEKFTARIDDENKIVFTVNNVEYTFDADALTLTHDGQSVSLTAAATEPEVDPLANTVWKGTLKGSGALNDKDAEISFTDSQVTVKLGDAYEFTSAFTFSAASGNVTANSFGESNTYHVSEISIKLSAGKLELSITIADSYDEFSFTYTAMLEKQAVEQEDGGIEGVYVGTLDGNGYMNGKTATLTLKGNNITLVLSELTFSGTYTYDDVDTITTTDLEESSGAYDVEGITLKFEGGVLKLTLNLCYDYDYNYDYTADLTKQGGGQEAADSITNTVWKGKLTKEDGPFAGVDGEDVEISFDGTQVTIKMGDAFEFKANYTYSSDSGISVNKDDFNESSDYAVTAITLNIVGGQIEFSISIEEQYDYYRFTYRSTLQKQSGGQ